MPNFWTHRCSNDIIFVVPERPEEFIRTFGQFLQNLPNDVRAYRYEVGTDYVDIRPDWRKLISIEVQTNKWMKGKCDTLHAKFYFEQEYAEAMIGKFGNNYVNNITSIASYWRDDDVGTIDQVFSNTDMRKSVLVLDNIAAGFGSLAEVSLPDKKDIYIIRRDYVGALKTFKDVFGV